MTEEYQYHAFLEVTDSNYRNGETRDRTENYLLVGTKEEIVEAFRSWGENAMKSESRISSIKLHAISPMDVINLKDRK